LHDALPISKSHRSDYRQPGERSGGSRCATARLNIRQESKSALQAETSGKASHNAYSRLVRWRWVWQHLEHGQFRDIRVVRIPAVGVLQKQAGFDPVLDAAEMHCQNSGHGNRGFVSIALKKTDLNKH